MKKIVNYIINIFILGCIFAGMFHSGKYLYIDNIGVDQFFVYESIEPIKSKYVFGEELKIESKMRLFRSGGDMFWNEILYCDIEVDEYDSGFFSSYKSSKKNLRVETYINEDGEMIVHPPWSYGGRTPTQNAKCYIFAQQEYVVEYGIVKENNYTTGPFYFYEK